MSIGLLRKGVGWLVAAVVLSACGGGDPEPISPEALRKRTYDEQQAEPGAVDCATDAGAGCAATEPPAKP
jgi:hypothetical protein